MNTVGTFLKKERKAHNISLMEVARLTKISPIYLKHIEKNEFKKIPQGPYIKGYIASYSSVIGCDADELIGLYESETRKQTQTEAIQTATASIDGGKHSADKSQKEKRKQTSSLWLGKLSSWFNTLVSFVLVNGISFRAVKEPFGSIDSSKQNKSVSSRQNDLGVKQFGFIGALHRRSTVRRIWVYSFIAIMGACFLILPIVGFYHLFIYEPNSSKIAEAEKSPNKVEASLPSVGSEPLTVFSQSLDESTTADTTDSHLNENVLSEPAKPDAGRSGKKKNVEISSSPSGPAIKTGMPSSDVSATTKIDASNRDTTDTEGTVQLGRRPFTDEPPPKPIIANAPLKVLKATTCRGVENRMPIGVDRSFPISAGKIYVWTEIEAKQVPLKIHHIYHFKGKKVSDVALDVRSTRWRTWSFKTIANHRYRGEWRVDIVTSEGSILRQLYFEVK